MKSEKFVFFCVWMKLDVDENGFGRNWILIKMVSDENGF